MNGKRWIGVGEKRLKIYFHSSFFHFFCFLFSASSSLPPLFCSSLLTVHQSLLTFHCSLFIIWRSILRRCDGLLPRDQEVCCAKNWRTIRVLSSTATVNVSGRLGELEEFLPYQLGITVEDVVDMQETSLMSVQGSAMAIYRFLLFRFVSGDGDCSHCKRISVPRVCDSKWQYASYRVHGETPIGKGEMSLFSLALMSREVAAESSHAQFPVL